MFNYQVIKQWSPHFSSENLSFCSSFDHWNIGAFHFGKAYLVPRYNTSQWCWNETEVVVWFCIFSIAKFERFLIIILWCTFSSSFQIFLHLALHLADCFYSLFDTDILSIFILAFSEVARAVARIIALALDLDGNFFDQSEMLGDPIAILRLLHYEGQVVDSFLKEGCIYKLTWAWLISGKISEPERGIYGAGAHSDFGLLTLLATDDVIGLQVYTNVGIRLIRNDPIIILEWDHEPAVPLQICKDKHVEPQIWEYVSPVKG